MSFFSGSLIGERARAQLQVQVVVDEKSRAGDLALASEFLSPLGRDWTLAEKQFI